MADEKQDVNHEEVVAVTGRPNDIPIREPESAPLGGNSTLADRAKARKKAVVSAENKAVATDETKSAAKRAKKG